MATINTIDSEVVQEFANEDFVDENDVQQVIDKFRETLIASEVGHGQRLAPPAGASIDNSVPCILHAELNACTLGIEQAVSTLVLQGPGNANTLQALVMELVKAGLSSWATTIEDCVMKPLLHQKQLVNEDEELNEGLLNTGIANKPDQRPALLCFSF